MKILNVVQGSAAWLAARARCLCASEAAAMMGVSPYMKRSELVRLKHTGDEKEFSEWAQKNLLDKGHAIEAEARAILEETIGELYPITATDDEGRLLASSDGITEDDKTGFECKSWNEELAADVRAGEIPPSHFWQLEQQIHIFGLERIIFVVTDGTPEKWVQHEYRAAPGRIEKLLAGWKQFEQDVKDYVHVEEAPRAVAEPVMALPALSIQVHGSISLRDNLSLFGEKLQAFVDGIDKAPADDQAFANAEAAVKTLEAAEKALTAAEDSALAQTASIDDMRRTVAMYRNLARETRLMLDKVVKAQKETIRAKILKDGVDAYTAYVKAINDRLAGNYMPIVQPDFAGAMKGKKTVVSLRDAVSTTLAHAKIAATETADRIDANLKALAKMAPEKGFLFNDLTALVVKSAEDFVSTVKVRLADHAAAEQKRLDEERERIRAEEQQKAQEAVAAAQPPAQTPAAIAPQPSVPAPVPTNGRRKKPDDEAIVLVVAAHYGITVSTAIKWLEDIDLKAAAKRLSKAAKEAA